MVNRENWKQVNRYLDYMTDVRQLSGLTIESASSQLRHLLEWADDVPFHKCMEIRPVFPRYIAAKVAASSIEPACSHVRQFFIWLRRSNIRCRVISDLWLETIVKPKGMNATHKVHEFSLEDVRAMLAIPTDSLRMKRDQAAVAFLFVSGMRVGAFETLPINAIDLDTLTIRQWPELGVNTKLRKRATTFLLEIPDLLDLARDWDISVRSTLPETSRWYAPIDVMTGDLNAESTNAMPSKFERGLPMLCDLAGIERRTPHALRHGFAVYGLKAARNISDMEAISKNLMHDSLEITLRVYAVLRDEDVRDRIVGLGKNV